MCQSQGLWFLLEFMVVSGSSLETLVVSGGRALSYLLL